MNNLFNSFGNFNCSANQILKIKFKMFNIGFAKRN